MEYDLLPLIQEFLEEIKKRRDFRDILTFTIDPSISLSSSIIFLFKINNIDFISSHGHTVLHQPNKKITYQIT